MDGNKTVTITVRLTPEQKQKLEWCAARLGMSKTEVIETGVNLVKDIIEKHQEKKEKENA